MLSSIMAIVILDNLIAYLYGSVLGMVHDSRLWNGRKMEEILECRSKAFKRETLHIYGDSTYKVYSYIISPFQGNAIAADNRQ